MSAGGGGSSMADTYIGAIKMFNPDKGWGMISCDQTFKAYGKDVFFLKSAVPGGHVGSDEQVRFSIRMEQKGPVAFNIQPLGGSSRGMGGGRAMMSSPPPAPMPPMPMPQMGGMPMGAHMMSGGLGPMMMGMGPMGPMMGGMQSAGSKAPSANQRYVGTFANYNVEKGWGFIQCEATKALYGKDVFVMRSVLKDEVVVEGTTVSFKVTMGAKGPQAAELTVLPAGVVGSNGRPGNTLTGTIKSFDPQKGFGFIESDEIRNIFGKDIFLHKRELSDQVPNVGDSVQFSVELDNRGQPQAKYPTLSGAGGYNAARTSPDGMPPRSTPY